MNIILIIDYNPYFTSSASSNRLLTLIEGLASFGASINIIICGANISKKEELEWLKKCNTSNVSINYILPNIVESLWDIRINKYIKYYFKEKKIINEVVKKILIDNSIVWTDITPLSLKLVKILKQKYPNLKFISEISEFLDIHNYNNVNYLQRLSGNYRKLLFENKAFFLYDGIALMTQTLLNYFYQFPNPKPKLLHLPMTVNLDRFTDKIKIINGFEIPYIAYVGVMNDAKDGVNILIQSFAKIHHKFPDQKLYLVGGWNYDTSKHLKIIKELSLESKIIWKGEFSSNQIPTIIKNASLLTLPRPDSKQAQGGFPTKLGEYLASGNPVCATSVGEIPNYLVDNVSVYFAIPGSVDSFADAMQRALENPEKSKKIGQNGKEVAIKHFNKDIQSKILYNFLNELIHENPK